MDPISAISLTAVGAEAIKQGIQFLYGQAGEVLKRWREQRAGESPSSVLKLPVSDAPFPELTAGHAEIDFDALDRLEPEIRALRGALGDYAEGIEVIDAEVLDPALAKAVDGLRRSLEAVLGQHLTFEGEDRAKSGLDVDVEMDIDDVAGYVEGVVADNIVDGRIRASVSVKTARPGSRIIGAKLAKN